MKKSGFVAIVGRPNVGKSTLLNYLIGEKLAGVSPKPQTTRGMIRGILTVEEGQIVFLDTPGHHRPHDELGNWMLREIRKASESADLIYLMAIPQFPGDDERKVLEALKNFQGPIFCVLNQIDRFSKQDILPVIKAYQELFPFKEIIPVSAKSGEQVPLLIRTSLQYLPEGEAHFPEDQISDQHERLFIQEIIREKIFLLTGQEIPYSTSVAIESMKERNEQLTDIQATIYVERSSQKKIIIGKGGHKLKEIGKSARLAMETFLNKKVFLQLWVKEMADWKQSPDLLKRLGYE